MHEAAEEITTVRLVRLSQISPAAKQLPAGNCSFGLEKKDQLSDVWDCLETYFICWRINTAQISTLNVRLVINSVLYVRFPSEFVSILQLQQGSYSSMVCCFRLGLGMCCHYIRAIKLFVVVSRSLTFVIFVIVIINNLFFLTKDETITKFKFLHKDTDDDKVGLTFYLTNKNNIIMSARDQMQSELVAGSGEKVKSCQLGEVLAAFNSPQQLVLSEFYQCY